MRIDLWTSRASCSSSSLLARILCTASIMDCIEVILGTWDDDVGANDNVLKYEGGLPSVAVVACNCVRADTVDGAEAIDVSGEARSRSITLFLASDAVLTLCSLLDGLGMERVKGFFGASSAFIAVGGPWTGVCAYIVDDGKA